MALHTYSCGVHGDFDVKAPPVTKDVPVTRKCPECGKKSRRIFTALAFVISGGGTRGG